MADDRWHPTPATPLGDCGAGVSGCAVACVPDAAATRDDGVQLEVIASVVRQTTLGENILGAGCVP